MAENSIFVGTPTAQAEDVKRLLKVALPLMQADGRIPWAKVTEALGDDFAIGYSRGWLIVREAWLRANNPDAFVPMAALTEAAAKKHGGNFDEVQHVLMPVVVRLRGYNAKGELDPKLPQYSWGEIMVRTGRTEGQVRRAFKARAGMFDLGQRSGKGGRYLADRGDLYGDGVRAKQGAHIAATTKHPRSVAVTELLNYVPPTTEGQATA
jgi:hypothetical protein